MSEDSLKKMLDDAFQRVADRDSAQKSAQERRLEELKASGQRLKERVMPRLLAAQAAWGDKLKLSITDNSDKCKISDRGGEYPSITASVMNKEHAAYIFSTHSPDYASVQEGIGPNRGTQAYGFQVNKIEDLTDAKIDEVLQALLNTSIGLKS